MSRTLAQIFRGYRERFRFRYGPRIANWRLQRATVKARRKIKAIGPIRLLIDNTVLDHATTHETAWIQSGLPTNDPNGLGTGNAARIRVHGDNSDPRAYRNVCYLTGIAHLSRIMAISLCSSDELEEERAAQPAGRFRGYGYFDYNLFEDARFEIIGEPAQTMIGPLGFSVALHKEQQFQRMRDRRKTDPIYDALVRRLGEKSSNDAWHIMEAERNGVFCFLTMDFKLLNNMDRQSKFEPIKSLNTMVLSPEQFGQKLGISPVDPSVMSYHRASFPVRSDLSMPDGKRRPSFTYDSSK